MPGMLARIFFRVAILLPFSIWLWYGRHDKMTLLEWLVVAVVAAVVVWDMWRSWKAGGIN